jgi:hypothetical protein
VTVICGQIGASDVFGVAEAPIGSCPPKVCVFATSTLRQDEGTDDRAHLEPQKSVRAVPDGGQTHSVSHDRRRHAAIAVTHFRNAVKLAIADIAAERAGETRRPAAGDIKSLSQKTMSASRIRQVSYRSSFGATMGDQQKRLHRMLATR